MVDLFHLWVDRWQKRLTTWSLCLLRGPHCVKRVRQYWIQNYESGIAFEIPNHIIMIGEKKRSIFQLIGKVDWNFFEIDIDS